MTRSPHFDKDEKIVPGPSVRARDAATLVLVRRDGDLPRVLMGKRSGKHTFMPNKYVFPGGRVDPGDGRLPTVDALHPETANSLLQAGISPARAKALAMAAIRETFEETGLIIGSAVDRPPHTKSKNWKPFFASGHVPQLGPLRYMFRAITPPNRVRRFDTRFFLVFTDEVSAEIPDQLSGSGELVDLHWIALSQSQELDVPNVTHTVLNEVIARVGNPKIKRPVPYIRFHKGRAQYEEH